MSVFERLEINNWRQFEKVEIDFHPQLTILTGANGAGKTTILNLLNRHYGWNIQFVATPRKDKVSGTLQYFAGLWGKMTGRADNADAAVFGSVHYSDGGSSDLIQQGSVGSQFVPVISGMQNLNGLHVPSHRPIFSYRYVGDIPTQPPKKETIFQTHRNYSMGVAMGNGAGELVSHMKRTLISLAIFGEGNKYVTSDPESLRLFEGFQDILAKMLPPELGFQKLIIENPEVLLDTTSGRFSLDAVSGGIASIIDLTWQIFMSLEKSATSVVTVDEPENHLHPKLQRALLPKLMEAFPNTQFIVVTHNPVVVTSVPNSNVYVLDFGDQGKVSTRKLDFANKAADANETLRDVLGLPTASPIWVEKRIREVVARYSQHTLTPESAEQLRKDLSELGLEKAFPEALVKVRTT